MRISDWSSDVCSSDLPAKAIFAEFPLPSCRTCSGIQRCSRTTAYIAWHDVGPRNKSGVTASRKSSVLLFIHQLVGADPGHHRAQFAADLFDRMRGGGLAAGLAFGLAGKVVEDEILNEKARLDVGEDALHLGRGLAGAVTKGDG